MYAGFKAASKRDSMAANEGCGVGVEAIPLSRKDRWRPGHQSVARAYVPGNPFQ